MDMRQDAKIFEMKLSKQLNQFAIATGLKEPPRRRGLGKKNPVRIAAENPNGERGTLAVSPSTSAAIRLSKRDYKQVVGIGGINSDWALSSLSEDADVWQNIFALRARSRDLFRTDVYFKKYKEELWANVFGSEGITCRMRVKEQEDRIVYDSAEKNFRQGCANREERIAKYLERKFANNGFYRQSATIKVGDLDLYANKLIEDAWARWKRREFCTVTGALSYNEVCQLRLLSCARDGDYFLRHVRSPAINEYGYSLQLINSEWCDFTLNTKTTDGNEVRMGIERDKWGKRVAYYFIRRSPMDWQFGTPGLAASGAVKTYDRIPAEDVIHYARYEDGDSTRPAPWSASVIQKSRHLDKYEEAEVVAARVSACKLGFFTSNQVPEGGEIMGDRPDPTQEATMDAEPGSFTGLKWGIDFKEWNPEHPNGNFDLFRKGMLRAWCAGMPGANYNIIANDLEGVNYSSGRLGMLDERELWKLIQKFDIEIAERPIFEEWLYMSLLTGAIPLPLAKFDKFNKPVFRGRRWAWVDPQKEVQANALQVVNNFTSRTRVIEDSDVDADFEQIVFELAEEKMLLEELGLDVVPVVGKVPPTKPAQDTADDAPPPAVPASKEMTLRQTLELIKATTPQPSAPSINVHVPEINVPAPVVNIAELKVPEQKAPVVHVAAAKVVMPPMPEIKPPDVVVNVKNEIKIPKTKKITIARDDEGKLSGLDVEKE
jgi:lambda family phage portal protein